MDKFHNRAFAYLKMVSEDARLYLPNVLSDDIVDAQDSLFPIKPAWHICHATKRPCPYDFKSPKQMVDTKLKCSGDCFSPYKEDVKNWEKEIDQYAMGNRSLRNSIRVSSYTPPILRKIIDDEFGVKENLSVYMNVADVEKSVKGKHQVTIEEIKKMPTELFNPIAVFRSSSHPHTAIVALVGIVDKETGGESVVPVWYARPMRHIVVNQVTSVYGKSRRSIEDWELQDGNLVYANMQKIGRFPAIKRALIARGGKDGKGRFAFLTEKDFFKGTT